MVPDDECAVMVSPSAVGGRYPTGHAQRKDRLIRGTDNRTFLLNPAMVLRPVPPLHLGGHLQRHYAHRRISIVKIDTEGEAPTWTRAPTRNRTHPLPPC